jgi:UDP-N-acetylglucosamine 2-epimerase
MSEGFFQDLEIPMPDYNIRVGSGLHGHQTGEILKEVEKLLIGIKPEFVIVFGDTNSTLAGALAASKLLIKTIHVEAGLRSFNRTMPEEINRVATDHISDYLFAPTETAMNNLGIEGLKKKSIFTGDIMVDSIKLALSKNDSFKRNNEDFVLLTLHRPYNVDDQIILQDILNKVELLKKEVVFPVHPRTRKMIQKNNLRIGENIRIVEPVGYIDFVLMQKNCDMIITDSGGIQKEAYILGKPCVTLRSETEWIETVDVGWNLLLDNSETKEDFVAKVLEFSPPKAHPLLFGDSVAEKMVKFINHI